MTHSLAHLDSLGHAPVAAQATLARPLGAAGSRDGVAVLVERCCDASKQIAVGIAALDGAELVWEPRINQGLVRFIDQRAGAVEVDYDKRTDDVAAAVVNGGEAFFTNTTWRGRRCMHFFSVQLADGPERCGTRRCRGSAGFA